MLDIKTADFRQTRFYQDVLEEGESAVLIHLLTRRLGELSEAQVAHIQGLSLAQLEQLTDVMLDLASLEALDAWLQDHPVAEDRAIDDSSEAS